MQEIQLTHRSGGHILTNIGVWSPDGQWIVYDTRSDPAGSVFDGETIEIVHVATCEVREIYRARHDAHCGVATFNPVTDEVVFILGPEFPTDGWRYSASHRQGIVVKLSMPGEAIALDARDLVAPFTPGALRGGSHVHVFSGDGACVSFTYDDHVLEALDASADTSHQRNQRNIGVALVGSGVVVPTAHPRNQNGAAFSVLATRTVNCPAPGSDEISRAVEDAWVGRDGYLPCDGARQRRAIAFQGQVIGRDGREFREAFIVDLPEDLTIAGDGPLQGTATTRPAPPRGTVQRRLTYTEERRFPGLQGPRHWLRSSPDGSRIAMLMRDDAGIVQLWTIAPHGGVPVQGSRLSFDVASAFSWSPDGRSIAHIADRSVFVTDIGSGDSRRLTPRTAPEVAPRPEACVFSPDGLWIAYVRPVLTSDVARNQIFITPVTS